MKRVVSSMFGFLIQNSRLYRYSSNISVESLSSNYRFKSYLDERAPEKLGRFFIYTCTLIKRVFFVNQSERIS